ncbi:acyl-CoA dehydrogenase family protein [Arthrobacter globiformis]|uniref:acyl-CoA dehydrogenase family protein n=1 Tax=Arthrobacter globiformis TaxID=1665 RepID=UPI00278FF7FB|nr:acyl-CoA dehydrogenase family protein [Arthrobacter globiformis]MDQ0618444.1 alkylation response protein AidB-like acyl-CoA dehydrogenase [Arthrobacter globiformis]
MEPLAEPLLQYPQRSALLEQARRSAAHVDAGQISPFTLLQSIGEIGLLDLGRSGSLLPMSAVIYDLASECVASAFSLWGHRMAVAYHDATGAQLPTGVLEAERPAASAMAPAFKAAAGISEIPVLARRVDGGLRISGSIPWASNIYDDAIVVLPVVEEDGKALIVRTMAGATGLTVRHLTELLALNATRSASLEFQNVFIRTSDIMTDDVPAFLTSIRKPFLLLQAAFCLGLSAAALNSAADGLTGVNESFKPDADVVTEEFRRLQREFIAMAEDPSPPSKLSLLQLRLDSAHLTGAATRLEAAVVGGRGYQSASATARRLREAAFLPVQSPTEGHLRWEIQHSQ